MKANKTIMVFGGGELQLSLIEKCKRLGFNTIVVDPNPNAFGGAMADHFVVIDGGDFESTCELVEKFGVHGIITAATDKPLVMMARIAERFDLFFFSLETAINTTDKWLMKKKFQENGIPHAKGQEIKSIPKDASYPIIIKPKDNSGSRGVIYCENHNMAEAALQEVFANSNMDTIILEEFIEGKEFSIEAVHFNGSTEIIQLTSKLSTGHPYNVELGHIAPVSLDSVLRSKVDSLIEKIADMFGFENCVSHTEIKINNGQLVVIETSPRLGGDLITSHLVPMATGRDIETELIQVSVGGKVDLDQENETDHVGIFYLELPEGVVDRIEGLEEISSLEWVTEFKFELKKGDRVPKITSSLDRYGYYLIKGKDYQELIERNEMLKVKLNTLIDVV